MPNARHKSRPVILYSLPWSFEDRTKLTADLANLAASNGVSGPYIHANKVIRANDIPEATIVVDLPVRLSDDIQSFLRFLKASIDAGAEVVIPGTVDLRKDGPSFRSDRAFIEALAGFPALRRRIRTKEGIALAKSRGRVVGRRPVSQDDTRQVIEIFQKLNSIRGTERAMKQVGSPVSRSAIQRILKRHSGGSNG